MYLYGVSLNMFLWMLCLWFWSYAPSITISLPLGIKLTMSHLLLFFLCNSRSFFSYVGGVLVTKLFSLLLINRYIVAIQQIITHEEHLRYSFWSVSKATIFYCFDVCSHVQPRYFQFYRKYQQYGLCFQTIFPFLMTMMKGNVNVEM